MKSFLSLLPIPVLAIGLCASQAVAETQGGALEADEVMIDDMTGAVEAVGNVELTGAGGRLTTEKLLLNRDTETVSIPTPLLLQETDGTKINAGKATLNLYRTYR